MSFPTPSHTIRPGSTVNFHRNHLCLLQLRWPKRRQNPTKTPIENSIPELRSYPQQKMSQEALLNKKWGLNTIVNCCCQGIWRQTFLTKWEHENAPKIAHSQKMCLTVNVERWRRVEFFLLLLSVLAKIYFFWHMNVLCRRSEDETPFWGEASRSIS